VERDALDDDDIAAIREPWSVDRPTFRARRAEGVS
jgi:hypothetical protein